MTTKTITLDNLNKGVEFYQFVLDSDVTVIKSKLDKSLIVEISGDEKTLNTI